MNIAATSNIVSTIASSQGASASPVNGAGSDSDGDGDGGGGHRQKVHHGGGHMREALFQVMQSLGLSMPQSTASTANSGQAAGSPAARGNDTDGDGDGSSLSGAGNVKNDMRQFMHALFQAIRGESNSTPASPNSDPSSSFATGLSSLITRSSTGAVPAGLQDAFAKLMSDLQGSGGTVAGASTGSAGGTSSAPVTLQDLLTKLQQQVGYGTSSPIATGNVVSTAA